jgi:regulator of sigma E protease
LATFDSPAARAGFQSGDKLIGVRRQGEDRFKPIANGWDLVEAEDRWRGEALEFQVQRGATEATIPVDAAYFWTAGFNLTMGPIRSVPGYSFAPASSRQFEQGDVIVEVAGSKDFDPLRLADLMRELAESGRDVRLTVQRKDKTLEFVIPRADLLGRGTWVEMIPTESAASLAIPALGISYDILPKIRSVQPGSPAEAAGLKAGDVLSSTVVRGRKGDVKTTFNLTKTNWSAVFWSLQVANDVKAVDFTYLRNGAEAATTVNFQLDRTWPLPHRGFNLELEMQTLTADSFSQAISLGFRETYRETIRMYLSLKSLVAGSLSVGTMSGPVGIAEIAYKTAEQGFTDFMFLLGFISINLAVVNFLPIPVLDGGHMVFLVWEKIRGRPASERAMAIANTLGLLVILSLLCFVLFLDLGGRRFFFGN